MNRSASSGSHRTHSGGGAPRHSRFMQAGGGSAGEPIPWCPREQRQTEKYEPSTLRCPCAPSCDPCARCGRASKARWIWRHRVRTDVTRPTPRRFHRAVEVPPPLPQILLEVALLARVGGVLHGVAEVEPEALRLDGRGWRHEGRTGDGRPSAAPRG